MADTFKKAATSGATYAKTPVSRRVFIGRAAGLSVAGMATGGFATSAAAAVAGDKVKTYKGKYAIDSQRIVDGFFAGPRGKTNLDVVVVISASGKLDAAAEATARNYAASGWLAIAPDLPATYSGAALGGKPAMVEALMADMPRLKRHPHGSGKVAIVAA